MDMGVADRGCCCACGGVQQSMIWSLFMIALGFVIGCCWAAWWLKVRNVP